MTNSEVFDLGYNAFSTDATNPFHSDDPRHTIFEEGLEAAAYDAAQSYDYDDSMDGDHDSAMASCGWGTDEDYGYYGDDY